MNRSPGSVRRRSLEIWSADSEMFVRDRPSTFVGSNESSCAVVITPADRPVGALIKVRTRRPAYRFAAAMPRSLRRAPTSGLPGVIHSGGDYLQAPLIGDPLARLRSSDPPGVLGHAA